MSTAAPSVFASATAAASTAAVTPGSTPSPSLAGLSIEELVALLPVATEDRTGYDRSLFVHWIDADGDGCSTRREVLIDEAVVAPTIDASCHLSGGQWLSLYDGISTTDSSTFDVDHVVALAEAWDSGASAWTADRRMRFANDLDVAWTLIAVTATSNREKSDLDPADWLPPVAGVRCEFLTMWAAIKVRWALSIDDRERSVLLADGVSCTTRLIVPIAP